MDDVEEIKERTLWLLSEFKNLIDDITLRKWKRS